MFLEHVKNLNLASTLHSQILGNEELQLSLLSLDRQDSRDKVEGCREIGVLCECNVLSGLWFGVHEFRRMQNK